MFKRLVCLLYGHDCVYRDLPRGWSRQPCKSCERIVWVFKR